MVGDGIEQVLGKQIRAVVVAESPRTPRKQVFVVFADETHFEFYATDSGFGWTKGVDPGGLEKVRAYIAAFPEARIKAEYFHQEEP